MKQIYVSDENHADLKRRAKEMGIKLYELCDLIFTTALEGMQNEDDKNER
jgi:hypothetical protein